MTTTHTSGPWTVEPHDEIVKVDGRKLRHLVVRDENYIWLALVNDEEVDTGKENARLIAAAPTLLAALKQAQRWLIDHEGMLQDLEQWGDSEQDLLEIMEQTCNQAEGR